MKNTDSMKMISGSSAPVPAAKAASGSSAPVSAAETASGPASAAAPPAGHSRLLHLLLDMGEMLLSCGAEINRVEDTLTRLGRCYGAAKMNVFVITSSIVITMVFPDGTEITRTRRILSGGGTDFTMLEDLNALSRECCAEPLSEEALAERLKEIRNRKHPQQIYYAGCALAAGSFAVFFGGSAADGIAAASFGLLTSCFRNRLGDLSPNPVTANLLSSAAVGILIGVTVRLLPFLHADMIMIGDIMLLIPGIAMTNAVRDCLSGDTISGLMRLAESLLWAGAIACGFLTAMFLTGIAG